MAEVHPAPQCNAAAGFHNPQCVNGITELYCSQIRIGQYYCNHGIVLAGPRLSEAAPLEVVDEWLAHLAAFFGLTLESEKYRLTLIALLQEMTDRLGEYGERGSEGK